MSKHTPGPWRVNGRAVVADAMHDGTYNSKEEVGAYGGFMVCESVKPENAALIAAAPDMLAALKAAAATIGAIYQWVERVETAGGATSLSGVAACHAMIGSLRKNANRTEKLVMAPARAAIAKAEGV